ncbi:hypothetical protein FYJ44_09965 [Desulfovibrio sp. PG-178-WT-4]|uniref:Uncharacterized protein n=1 Tax=Desulfovibrio porci TaxID=2605782 RepID=A0A6L5XM42_9BACT|nr:hypothetical protein [Desulfovibrio porci]MDY3809642.1 hypothetical protein [Desulfovibrio porci]MSS28353.1 hypothetical protein [Desulfovibrio porci]
MKSSDAVHGAARREAAWIQPKTVFFRLNEPLKTLSFSKVICSRSDLPGLDPSLNSRQRKAEFFSRQGAKRELAEAVLAYREVNFRFTTPLHGKRGCFAAGALTRLSLNERLRKRRGG